MGILSIHGLHDTCALCWRMQKRRADDVHSSRITLSPKITVSNSPFSIKRFRMVRQGLLRALASKAHTPILPITFAFLSRSFSSASAVLLALDDIDDRFALEAFFGGDEGKASGRATTGRRTFA